MLEVQNIAFAYGRRRILEDVTLKVDSGETVALVGANGSGKTTLMRVLSGLLLPTSGMVRADGFDVAKEPIRFRRALGYLPEHAPIEPDLRVADYLKFRAKVKGEKVRKIRHRVAEALEACGLTDLGSARIGLLSNGQKRLVALAEALLLRPRFLLADDLFAGVDPGARVRLGKTIASLSQFTSVIVSGHELGDLGAFATRFILLRDGKLAEVKGAAGARAALAS